MPPEIRVYAERLINFLPPRFDMRSASSYPAYEARAMAYIIFVMKLLFGLDGHKEHRMSKAAKKMNQKIMELNYTNSENRPLLFVWDEWLQYIEMRKVIVSRYNPAFCKQFKQCESTAQILNQMSDDLMKREDQEHNRNDKNEHAIIKQRMDSFKALFETFMEKFKKTSEENPALYETVTEPKIEFQVTLTPALSYFKTILLHYDKQNLLSNCNENYPKIPQFMRTDHTRRDMQSYLQVRPIWEYFQNNQKELRVTSLGATANRNFVGIFRAPRQFLRHSRKQIVNFEISDAEWMEKVAKEMVVNTDDLEWNTQFEICPEDRSKKKNMCSNFAAINIVGTDARVSKKNHNS